MDIATKQTTLGIIVQLLLLFLFFGGELSSLILRYNSPVLGTLSTLFIYLIGATITRLIFYTPIHRKLSEWVSIGTILFIMNFCAYLAISITSSFVFNSHPEFLPSIMGVIIFWWKPNKEEVATNSDKSTQCLQNGTISANPSPINIYLAWLFFILGMLLPVLVYIFVEPDLELMKETAIYGTSYLWMMAFVQHRIYMAALIETWYNLLSIVLSFCAIGMLVLSMSKKGGELYILGIIFFGLFALSIIINLFMMCTILRHKDISNIPQ